MVSYAQSFQIFCIFLVFFLSLLGFYFPIYVNSCSAQSQTSFPMKILSNQSFYLLLKCFGSGIILGVSLIHLLADAVGDLGEYGEYPCKFYCTREL